jgi:signal transduction histidine kinase
LPEAAGLDVHFLISDADERIVAHSPGLPLLLGLPAAELQVGAFRPDIAGLVPPGATVHSQDLSNGQTAHSVIVAANAAAHEIATLRETLDAVNASIVVFDRDHRYRFGNNGYHEAFPHLPPDSVLAGMPYRDVLRLSVAAGSVGDPQAYTDVEAFIDRRDTETRVKGDTTREDYTPHQDRWWQVRAAWTPSGARVALRVDVTEIRRLQQNLLRAQRLEIVGKMSGSVAHDFNNLLTVIIGSLEMIQIKAGRPAEVIALAENALTAAEDGARLTHEMLTFARREMTHPRVVDPVALLMGMEDMLRRAIGQAIEVRLGPHTTRGQIRVDALQYEAALLNLVMNARQAIDRAPQPPPALKGSIAIAVREGVLADGSRAVTIDVSDSGCGMPADIAAQAFEPFFTTSDNAAGPGLGLAQVQSFAVAAGGEAVLTSSPGGGTRVTVLLPHVVAPEPAIDVHAEAPDGGEYTILVVEDDAAVLATTLQSLDGLGHRVLTAASPLEALDMLGGLAAIDLLFTDIVMPGPLNGVQLAQAACRLRPDLHVLLTTGFSAGSLPDGAEAERFEVLRKPYRRQELVSRLSQLLAKSGVLAG